MRKSNRVVGVLCSDVHLSLRPPIARAEEPSWFNAMGRAVNEVARLSAVHGDVPIFCAGDLFDRWNASAELINWAIENLPRMHAIPGQHDLPHHSRGAIKRSAYWSLVLAGKVVHSIGWSRVGDVYVRGFGWDEDLTGCPSSKEDKLTLALVHRYVWKKGCAYPGAPEDGKLSKIRRQLRGFSAVAIGDNHRGFHSPGKTDILNCGTLMRRKADEVTYTPTVGLLRADGSIQTHALQTGEDVITVPDEPEVHEHDVTDFLEHLSRLSTGHVDFREAVRRTLDHGNYNPAVRAIVMEALE